jgi:hypothetical protein
MLVSCLTEQHHVPSRPGDNPRTIVEQAARLRVSAAVAEPAGTAGRSCDDGFRFQMGLKAEYATFATDA